MKTNSLEASLLMILSKKYQKIVMTMYSLIKVLANHPIVTKGCGPPDPTPLSVPPLPSNTSAGDAPYE